MKMTELTRDYFEKLCEFIPIPESWGDPKVFKFTSLLRHLFKTEFYWTIELDENRAGDGKYMRYFVYTDREGINPAEYEAMLNYELGPCNCLEMMVALAIRMSDELQGDDDGEPNVDLYFWSMIESLGLADQYDRMYDPELVRKTVKKFLDHRYQRDGLGGLFTAHNTKTDMRTLQIWDQMAIWFNEYIFKVTEES